MDRIVGKAEKTSIDIVVDIDGVYPHPATSWEQKFGYKPDVYIIRRTDGDPVYCLTAEAAWTHATAALVAEKCDMFGFELGDLFFVYEPERCRFILDCVMNPAKMRYEVFYTVNDEPGFVRCATFAEAKKKADEEYGLVRTAGGGQRIYWKKEPDDSYIDIG